MQTALLFLMAALASAAERAALAGTWNCTLLAESGGEFNWRFEFNLEDGLLTGTARGETDGALLTGVDLDGQRLSLVLSTGEETYRIAAKLDGGSLSGEWITSDNRGRIHGFRE
jgi:hypothetical protein